MLDNLTNQDIIILCCLVCSAFIIGIICIFLTLKKDKIKFETSEDDISSNKTEPDINVALATENIPEISEEEPTLEQILSIDEEKDYVEKIDIDKETEQDTQNRLSIEEVLRAMNEDLEKQKYAKIDRYEEEQEENAVISYQELVARKMALGKEQDEIDVLPESYNETVEEFEEVIDKVEAEKPKKIVTTTQKESRFSNSEFISPIFGRLEDNLDYPTLKKVEETETFTETKVTEENMPKQNDEFLSTLKEFRKNL